MTHAIVDGLSPVPVTLGKRIDCLPAISVINISLSENTDRLDRGVQ